MTAQKGEHSTAARKQRVMALVGGRTRFLVLVPVLGLLAGAIALVLLGAWETVHIIGGLIGSGEISAKETIVAFIEVADMFLLGVVLYIISLGLYELFIDPDLELPHWLEFRNLDDLKHQLVAVVIVVLAVLFLGKAIHTDSAQDLFWSGAGIALVVAALAYFLKGTHGSGGGEAH